nr:PREDICTED: uncharacterized protein LOC108222412 isoform X2 [Daucus carota subsp. sativus]
MDDNKYKGRLIIRTEVYYTTISPCIFLLSKSVAGGGGGGSTSAWYVWVAYFIVTDMFEDRDYMLIMSIPIQQGESDSWYWKKDKMGQYSVKSAYAMIEEKKYNAHSSDSSGFWKRIWNLKIPPNIKNLVWRAASECLPTKDHLQMKRVHVNIVCPICNSEAETTRHIMVDCSFARACWQSIGVALEINDIAMFKDWLAKVLDSCNKADGAMVLMLC